MSAVPAVLSSVRRSTATPSFQWSMTTATPENVGLFTNMGANPMVLNEPGGTPPSLTGGKLVSANAAYSFANYWFNASNVAGPAKKSFGSATIKFKYTSTYVANAMVLEWSGKTDGLYGTDPLHTNDGMGVFTALSSGNPALTFGYGNDAGTSVGTPNLILPIAQNVEGTIKVWWDTTYGLILQVNDEPPVAYYGALPAMAVPDFLHALIVENDTGNAMLMETDDLLINFTQPDWQLIFGDFWNDFSGTGTPDATKLLASSHKSTGTWATSSVATGLSYVAGTIPLKVKVNNQTSTSTTSLSIDLGTARVSHVRAQVGSDVDGPVYADVVVKGLPAVTAGNKIGLAFTLDSLLGTRVTAHAMLWNNGGTYTLILANNATTDIGSGTIVLGSAASMTGKNLWLCCQFAKSTVAAGCKLRAYDIASDGTIGSQYGSEITATGAARGVYWLCLGWHSNNPVESGQSLVISHLGCNGLNSAKALPAPRWPNLPAP